VAVADEVRERIRQNVGHPNRPAHHFPPRAVAPPVFLRAGRVVAGRPAPAPGAVLPGPLPPPPGGVELLPSPPLLGVSNPGRSFAITMAVLAGVRLVRVTPRLGFPYLIRRVTIQGDNSILDAVSFRLLISPDNDETATATPTGDDIIDFNTDIIGAEDTGLHAHLTAGPLELEPWLTVTTQGTNLKAKVHNASAATKRYVFAFDLDELI